MQEPYLCWVSWDLEKHPANFGPSMTFEGINDQGYANERIDQNCDLNHFDLYQQEGSFDLNHWF